MNFKQLVFGLAVASLALGLVGCGGSGNSGGGGVVDGKIDMTITGGGGNNDYTSMVGTSSPTTGQISVADTNVDGNGILTIIAIIPDGATGKAQTMTLVFAHDTGLTPGMVLPVGSSSTVDYTETTTSLDPPYDTTYKIWLATSGSLKIVSHDGNTVKVELQNANTDPSTDAGVGVGHPVIAGTIEGKLAA